MANLHISKAKSDGDAIFNNTDINDKNVVIAECADGVRTFYLDYNGLYTDDSGFLKQELTFDGVHLYAKYYQPWLDYIKSHAVK
jgi:lysophospholipase L1-like esterase